MQDSELEDGQENKNGTDRQSVEDAGNGSEIETPIIATPVIEPTDTPEPESESKIEPTQGESDSSVDQESNDDSGGGNKSDNDKHGGGGGSDDGGRGGSDNED